MSKHYYDASPDAAHSPGSVRMEVAGRQFTLHTDSGVFSKGHIDRGTRLMIEAMERGSLTLPVTGTVCDLGCGYGPLGLAAAALAPKAHVYMVDVNERAAALAAQNARENGLHNTTVRAGNGLGPYGDVRFDLIVSNPPLRTGKAAVYNLLAQARAALLVGGRLAVVIRTQQGARSLAKFLEDQFGNVRELEKGGGFRVYEATRGT